MFELLPKIFATALTKASGPLSPEGEAAGVARQKDDTTGCDPSKRISRQSNTDLTDCGLVPPTCKYKSTQ